MLLTLLALTAPLSIDTFLVAAAIGLTGPSRKHRLRLSVMFAVFEGGMPLIGLLIGGSLGQSLGSAAEYIAIAVLVGLGLFMVLRPQGAEDDEAKSFANAQGFAMLALGLSISLDGLAVGITYGLLKLPVLWVSVLMVGQAFLASQIGFAIGGRLPQKVRDNGEKLAGVVLLAIGVVLLIQKLT